MNVVRRSALGTLAALTITMAGPAINADAAGYHFQTLASINGGHVQACRIPTAASQPFTIKMRLNASRATSRLNGSGSATRNGNRVGKAWASGWIRKGHISKVGTVRVPRGATYGLDAGIGAGQMGNGGSFKPAAIRTCG